MKRIRSAIIGTGSISRAHVRATQQIQERAARGDAPALEGLDLQLVAAMDVNGERAAAYCAQHGIPHAYASVDELLRGEQPDLVHICTPPGPHCDLIVQCLEGGAWVLCEKPLCGSLAEMDRIEDAERRTGRYCSSIFQIRFGSGAQHLKRLIDANALGRPLVGVCQTTWYRDAAYYAVPWHARWQEAFGGPTMTLGIHTMDLFLWLLGEWREVSAMAGRLDRQIEVEDVSVAIAELESGLLATLMNSALSPRQETYLRIDCQKGTAEARYLYSHTNAAWSYSLSDHPAFHATPEQLRELEGWRALEGDEPSGQSAQLAALLRALLRGERPPVSGPDVRRTLEFVSCLYKSAAERAPVRRGTLERTDPFYQRVYGTLAQTL